MENLNVVNKKGVPLYSHYQPLNLKLTMNLKLNTPITSPSQSDK
jgi:hypothetical protein